MSRQLSDLFLVCIESLSKLLNSIAGALRMAEDRRADYQNAGPGFHRARGGLQVNAAIDF